MTLRMLVALVAVVVPVDVLAQCGSGFIGRVSVGLNLPSTDAVFTGTVTDVTEFSSARVITFEVERVWKGNVAAKAVVYRPTSFPPTERRGSGNAWLVFEVGKRYVVFANEPSLAERDDLEIGDAVGAWAIHFCGGGSLPIEFADFQGLDEGRSPR